jgi:hypothetical protein
MDINTGEPSISEPSPSEVETAIAKVVRFGSLLQWK